MDIKEISVIQKNKDLIIKDLHGDVFDSLKEKGILTSEEYDAINAIKFHQEDRNKKFLEILFSKPGGLKPFLHALEEWYDWIEKKLKEELKEQNPKWQEAVTHILPLPPRNVSRNKLLEKVRSKLRTLQHGKYVVLHGMSGCGKSSLAAEALHDDITVDVFKGKIHWMFCGKRDPDDKNRPDDVLELMMQLNERICDDELVSDTTQSTNTLNIKLKKRFEQSDFKDGLIVLDDVISPHVIDALNIGCKTLVTTFDTDFLKAYESHCEFITVSEGFTEEETLEHLALSVGMEVKDLPKQAKEIHCSGKGHPLVMSLIGAQLNSHPDEAKNSGEYWKTFVDVLNHGKYENLNRKSLDGQPLLPTFDLCLNSLNPNQKEKYLDFVIFVEDVNITVEVLATLWNEEPLRVKLIMDDFIAKSLIVSKYNSATNFTVYGIHDLLLQSLRKELNSDQLKKRHLNLINHYMEGCGGDLSKLPKNDNYLFYYIGYHIHNSGEYKLFPEWYFNLDFIEGKLKIAGPGDLLLDYKRYGDDFSKDCFNQDLINKTLNDFKKFVELSGVDVRRNNGPDIVQLALQEPHDSEVFKTAQRLAESRTNKTYLFFQLGPSESRSAPHTIQKKEKVLCACFANNNEDLIVGLESGTVEMINGKVLREYAEHKQPVTLIDICPVKNIFLSAADKSVKIWTLPELDGNVHFAEEDRTPSPSQRQSGYCDVFSSKQIEKHSSLLTFDCKGPVTCACFSSDGRFVATCSNRVEIWEVNKKAQKNPIRSVHFPGNTCVFSHNNEELIVGCPNCLIFVYNIRTGLHQRWDFGPYPTLSLFLVPGTGDGDLGSVGILTKKKLTISQWHHDSNIGNEKEEQKVPCMRDYNFGQDEYYVRCTAARDGTFVAVATSTGKILICALNDGSLIRPLDHSYGQIKYLAVDGSVEHRVVATYEDSTLRVWKMGPLLSDKQANIKPNFVVGWDSNSQLVLAAPTSRSVKKIYGKNEKSEDIMVPSMDEVHVCGISRCGKYIAMSTSGGEVFLHHGGVDQVPVKVMTVEIFPAELKVVVLDNQIFVIAQLINSIVCWTCDVDSISTPSEAKEIRTCVSSLIHQVVKCFILPNTKELITVDQIDCIKKWCLITGKEMGIVHSTRRVEVRICDADLSCDDILVTLDNHQSFVSDPFLNVYPLKANLRSKSIKLTYPPSCCSFSSDGKKLVVGYKYGKIQITDVVNGELVGLREVWSGQDLVESVRVGCDGCVWAATLTRLLMIPPGEPPGQARLRVRRLVLMPDDTTLVTVDSDGQLHFINNFRKNTVLSAPIRRPRSDGMNKLHIDLPQRKETEC